ncbi:MAG: hypothetical protein GWP03_02195 [Proteobacteria bacterium]|nr:hypothetical protein [Pseudomonadota bacterium]
MSKRINRQADNIGRGYDSSNCVRVGFYQDDNANSIYVKDTLAYVVNYDHFLVVNIPDPHNPTLIGSCNSSHGS